MHVFWKIERGKKISLKRVEKNLFLHVEHYDFANGIIDVTKNWCTFIYRDHLQDLIMKNALKKIILK